MSDSVRPHRRQPTRLPRPWDSPGKDTGVGCHFLLQCMKMKSKVKSLGRVQPSETPWAAAFQAPPSMGFSSKNTGVGCHCFLQRSYPRNYRETAMPFSKKSLLTPILLTSLYYKSPKRPHYLPCCTQEPLSILKSIFPSSLDN